MTRSMPAAADWLAAHPAPIHTSEVQAWSDRVRVELGGTALSELVELLAHGDLEQQYQAVAAARALGVEVWAEGVEPDILRFADELVIWGCGAYVPGDALEATRNLKS